jgi:hypothetical protein
MTKKRKSKPFIMEKVKRIDDYAKRAFQKRIG